MLGTSDVGSGHAATQAASATPGFLPKAFGPFAPPTTRPTSTTQPATASALDAVGINRVTRAEAASTQPAGAAASTAPTFDTGRVLLSLALVIGLILFLKWGGKKLFGLQSGTGTGVMQVVSRTILAPKQQLLLVRVGKRLLIVGDSGGRLSGIGQIADPDEVACLLSQSKAVIETTPKSVNFAGLFRRLGQSRSGRAEEADWAELEDQAMVPSSERTGLLGETDQAHRQDRANADALMDEADIPGDTPELPMPGRTVQSEAEDEARSAVEAARYDIQALRAKLREVTGRLTGPEARGETPDSGNA
ncbi:FliO/MopB family protein [Humisphaera borealis]|uniref:FliO/MopB family protein n=1 Tax=Humisphaera borealis TaxID=2807512 RepID=A0A7M2X1I8_9BACT|nr:flagellar biosynthetic protein FliO [Humisphaera borealis]QOV91617.1 FliO/MopB family protein [Humisphaera borealis]